MKLARLVLVLFLAAGWAAARCGAQTTTSDDKSKKDSSATAEHKDGEHKEMSCGCCKNMGKKDAMKADNKDASKSADKDAAKSEAKSEGGMMAGGMGCCASMGKDKAGGGMSCGGGKKAEDSKSGTLPDQKMK